MTNAPSDEGDNADTAGAAQHCEKHREAVYERNTQEPKTPMSKAYRSEPHDRPPGNL